MVIKNELCISLNTGYEINITILFNLWYNDNK